LRQALLGAGFSCLAEDCVEWNELAPRIARGATDLLVMQTDQQAHANWAVLSEALQIVEVPAIAVGPNHPEGISLARNSGVVKYVDQQDLPGSLDNALDGLHTKGAIKAKRGQVIAVAAPLAGCGCTTVAVNLAGALAQKFSGEEAFIEIAAQGSPVADWLGFTPDHPADELFARYHRLDSPSLKAMFTRHPQGLQLLINSPEVGGNPKLDAPSIKRLSVLTRMAALHTVLSVQRPESELGLAALRAADQILLVIRGDVPAIKRSRRLLTNLLDAGFPGDSIRCVLNRDGQAGQLTAAQIEAGLGRAVAHRIPEDVARVNRAMNFGQLLTEYSGTRIARSFRRMADDLTGLKKPASAWWRFGF
jgi:pilus assembly protein CpaE